MKRNHLNTNQTLYTDSTYNGLPVMQSSGPLIEQYLKGLQAVVEDSLQAYGRVFAFRVDLRFPDQWGISGECLHNDVVSRFVESFKAKIRHNRSCARKLNPYAHNTVVRYAWARELGQHGWPHYHFVFLLNENAFFSLGQFEVGRDNIFNRLQQAWASALGLSVDMAAGLVHIPANPVYHLRRDDPQSVSGFFYRASYLCKTDTKSFGSYQHGFGASRR
jgi:hypothetical protein